MAAGTGVVKLPSFTVVVTGSECTGKSTLAEALAGRFGAPWSREFAREYAERKPGSLDASDVEPIARGQLALELAAERLAVESGARLVVRDTDLLSTVAYSRHYYGDCPAWVLEAATRRVGDLYLLLSPDVAWVADGVRDRPDADVRGEIHALFRRTLAEAGARVVEITGDWPSRDRGAQGAVAAALAAADLR
jgi:NadR type nicotinamide-nucleotide adenylyltransferase